MSLQRIQCTAMSTCRLSRCLSVSRDTENPLLFFVLFLFNNWIWNIFFLKRFFFHHEHIAYVTIYLFICFSNIIYWNKKENQNKLKKEIVEKLKINILVWTGDILYLLFVRFTYVTPNNSVLFIFFSFLFIYLYLILFILRCRCVVHKLNMFSSYFLFCLLGSCPLCNDASSVNHIHV